MRQMAFLPLCAMVERGTCGFSFVSRTQQSKRSPYEQQLVCTSMAKTVPTLTQYENTFGRHLTLNFINVSF